MADRANFRQVYEILSKRKVETDKIPLPVMETLKALTASFAKPVYNNTQKAISSGREPPETAQGHNHKP